MRWAIPQATDCADLLSTGHTERQPAASCVPCQQRVDPGGWTSALTNQTLSVSARTGAVGGSSNVDYSGREQALVSGGNLISGEILVRGGRASDH